MLRAQIQTNNENNILCVYTMITIRHLHTQTSVLCTQCDIIHKYMRL